MTLGAERLAQLIERRSGDSFASAAREPRSRRLCARFRYRESHALFSGALPSRDVEAVLALLAEVVMYPTFPLLK